jgi:Mn-dependent DtxR family transcriptional regulator
MADTLFVRASDVAKEMGVSEAMAYKIIRKLNNQGNRTLSRFV